MHDLSRSQTVKGKDFPMPPGPSSQVYTTRAGRRLLLAAAFLVWWQTADERRPHHTLLTMSSCT